jgi:zinc transport system permease protein
MFWRWSKMLISTLNEELAYSNGINPRREKFFLTIALAITVAVSIKVVGLLLISALLIIPAAAARTISRTPEEMVIITAVLGVISAISGLQFSYSLNTPPGPSIVCVSLALFLVLRAVSLVRSN